MTRTWPRRLVILALAVLLPLATIVAVGRYAAHCWVGVDCDAVHDRPEPLPSVAMVSVDGYYVSVEGPLPCSGTDTLSATEAPDRVVLRYAYSEPEVHGPVCRGGAAKLGTWNVRLGVPLGTRALIDGCTGLRESWSYRDSAGPLTVPDPAVLWWGRPTRGCAG